MNERQAQFRVGLFVLAAMIASGAMVVQFGEFHTYWRPRYAVTIQFRSAPGISVATPVRRNGVLIGSVTDVAFDDVNGGLSVVVKIDEGVKLWGDARPRLVSSLLGDASIEFFPGKSGEPLRDGAVVQGESAADPMSVVGRIEQNVNTAIESFEKTSREWQAVGRNINTLLATNQGNLQVVVARSAEALTELTRTIKTFDEALVATSQVIADPRNQKNLQATLAALPQLTAETQKTVVTVRAAVEKADENLRNLSAMTSPLSKRSVTLATHLESTLTNLDSLSGELAQFAKTVNAGDGSLHRMATDPTLYNNLSRSSESLTVLLQNVDPLIRDLRIFADKVARHPELIGVSGALKGSSGLKDPPTTNEAGRVSTGDRRMMRQ